MYIPKIIVCITQVSTLDWFGDMTFQPRESNVIQAGRHFGKFSMRSLRVKPECIALVRQALDSNGYSSQALAEEVGLSRATVLKFLNGFGVDRLNFVELSKHLSQDWEMLADSNTETERVRQKVIGFPATVESFETQFDTMLVRACQRLSDFGSTVGSGKTSFLRMVGTISCTYESREYIAESSVKRYGKDQCDTRAAFGEPLVSKFGFVGQQQPFLPGSTLKGRLRSAIALALEANQSSSENTVKKHLKSVYLSALKRHVSQGNVRLLPRVKAHLAIFNSCDGLGSITWAVLLLRLCDGLAGCGLQPVWRLVSESSEIFNRYAVVTEPIKVGPANLIAATTRSLISGILTQGCCDRNESFIGRTMKQVMFSIQVLPRSPSWSWQLASAG